MDFAIAFPIKRDSGAFGEGLLDGSPVWTIATGAGAGAFAAAFFFTESVPEMSRADPSRSETGINIYCAV
jgi:hypothetical protein